MIDQKTRIQTIEKTTMAAVTKPLNRWLTDWPCFVAPDGAPYRGPLLQPASVADSATAATVRRRTCRPGRTTAASLARRIRSWRSLPCGQHGFRARRGAEVASW